jgi:hypothetical protein
MNYAAGLKDGDRRWFRATTKPVDSSWKHNEAFQAIKKSKKAVQLQFCKANDPESFDLWYLEQVPRPGYGSVCFNVHQVNAILVPDISHNLELI